MTLYDHCYPASIPGGLSWCVHQQVAVPQRCEQLREWGLLPPADSHPIIPFKQPAVGHLPATCPDTVLWSCSSGALGGELCSEAAGWANPLPEEESSYLTWSVLKWWNLLHHSTGSDSSLPEQIHHLRSASLLSSTMGTQKRDSQTFSCSCNRWVWGGAARKTKPLSSTEQECCCSCVCVFSEAFLALQSEVSRLKKDLQDGLVQLPHLAQRMDYLSSKYRQDRRSRTRPRTHLKPACRWGCDPAGQRFSGIITLRFTNLTSKGTEPLIMLNYNL